MKKFASKVVAVVMALVMVMSLASFAFAASDTIKVGVLAPLTGAVAQYGNAVNNGVMMYFEELNANGGINGKQVELVTYDEEGDPVKAVTGYNYLMDQGVVAIVGDVTTGPTKAVVAESQADLTPMITASATAEDVTCQLNEDGSVAMVYENMFRSCFIDPFAGRLHRAQAPRRVLQRHHGHHAPLRSHQAGAALDLPERRHPGGAVREIP